MPHSSQTIITHLIAVAAMIQLTTVPAMALDSSEASLRYHYPIAPQQGFATTCPGGISFGWISNGVLNEYPGSDIGDIRGDDPQQAPPRTGYYVGAFQYTLASRGKQDHEDSVIFCYDNDHRQGHPATILNAWIIPATSPLKSCIMTENTKRLVCSQ